MPQLFAEIPGGSLLAILFFLGLAFAAFSSLISMIELASRVFVDLGLTRPAAVGSVCGVGFLLGLPSAINLNVLSNQDFVWGVALMISGAFVATAVIRHGVRRFRRDVVDASPRDWRAGPAWDVLITVLVPLQAVVLLGWWLYLSATTYAPDTWFNPLDPFSVMTCLVQWGLVLLILVLGNRWMVDRTLPENR
jgi:NSS family neurotransmitter:Na+ symporter